MKKSVLGLLRFAKGVCRSVYQSSRYEIKRGYLHRSEIVPYDDRGQGELFQKEVYQKAKMLMEQNGWQSIMDIGCGSGYKLMKYLGAYRTLGVDLPHVIAIAEKEYPHARWLSTQQFNAATDDADLILCADVIEHVEHPDEFLKALFTAPNWKCIMISTPERNLKRGWFHFGPPPNPSHWREWTKKEFFRFVSQYHPIHIHEITNHQQATQLVICMNANQDPAKE